MHDGLVFSVPLIHKQKQKAMTTIKLFKVSTKFSSREVNARTKKEAITIFKSQLGNMISKSDKIIVLWATMQTQANLTHVQS